MAIKFQKYNQFLVNFNASNVKDKPCNSDNIVRNNIFKRKILYNHGMVNVGQTIFKSYLQRFMVYMCNVI